MTSRLESVWSQAYRRDILLTIKPIRLMQQLLTTICAHKRDYIRQCEQAVPLAQLEEQVAALPPARDFVGALQAKRAAGGSGLIAELKRFSPSAGRIRDEFDPATLAAAYAAGGAACLSVLTDQPYFKGRDRDIQAAAAAGLPILRKDFMLTPYQVAEARAIGADCILLIMAALTDAEAAALHAAALRYDLAVLIEVHDAAELARALQLPSGMIGINNRNLQTLQIDLATTRTLAPMVPATRLVVSESGLQSAAQLQELRALGVECFLVGEHLLKQPDLTAATRALLGA
jgi:indole-3-glycerol phosphate synthase